MYKKPKRLSVGLKSYIPREIDTMFFYKKKTLRYWIHESFHFLFYKRMSLLTYMLLTFTFSFNIRHICLTFAYQHHMIYDCISSTSFSDKLYNKISKSFTIYIALLI